MSAALVKKSLELVDPDINLTGRKKKKLKSVFGLIPEQQKILIKHKKQGKAEKINLLSSHEKYTIKEARKKIKSKEKLIQDNLKKLKLIQKACKVNLDKYQTKTIIERAVTKRPVKKIVKVKKPQKTAFTEEDFKKFEEEYFDE